VEVPVREKTAADRELDVVANCGKMPKRAGTPPHGHGSPTLHDSGERRLDLSLTRPEKFDDWDALMEVENTLLSQARPNDRITGVLEFNLLRGLG
jgi:hypothetical protein